MYVRSSEGGSVIAASMRKTEIWLFIQIVVYYMKKIRRKRLRLINEIFNMEGFRGLKSDEFMG